MATGGPSPIPGRTVTRSSEPEPATVSVRLASLRRVTALTRAGSTGRWLWSTKAKWKVRFSWKATFSRIRWSMRMPSSAGVYPWSASPWPCQRTNSDVPPGPVVVGLASSMRCPLAEAGTSARATPRSSVASGCPSRVNRAAGVGGIVTISSGFGDGAAAAGVANATAESSVASSTPIRRSATHRSLPCTARRRRTTPGMTAAATAISSMPP